MLKVAIAAAILGLMMGISAVPFAAAAPRGGAQDVDRQETVPTPPDPVAVQKWFGRAVGDILTVPDKVLNEGAAEKK